jgi:death on curing protein
VTAYLEIEDALQVVDPYGFPSPRYRSPGLGLGLGPSGHDSKGVDAYPQLAMKAAALMESEARFHLLIDRTSGPRGR